MSEVRGRFMPASGTLTQAVKDYEEHRPSYTSVHRTHPAAAASTTTVAHVETDSLHADYPYAIGDNPIGWR